MPKSTFMNLTENRRKEIISACIIEFEEKRFEDARVSNIITRLGIARGTFYKYFKDLEDCYFYILLNETKEIHEILIDLLKNTNYDLINVLNIYGDAIVEEIHDEKKYLLYCNRYLSWTPVLQSDWQDYCKSMSVKVMDFDSLKKLRPFSEYNVEIIHLLKSVIHNLIERNYVEKWSKKEFISHYEVSVNLIINGIKDYSGR